MDTEGREPHEDALRAAEATVGDLWSSPPGAVRFDGDSPWADEAVLDRLSTMLPALGGDLGDLAGLAALARAPDGVGLGDDNDSGNDALHAAALLADPLFDDDLPDGALDDDVRGGGAPPAGPRPRSGLGRPSGGLAAGRRASRGATPARAPRRVGPVGLVAVLLLAYVVAVAATIALTSLASSPDGGPSGGTRGQQVVIDGPPGCPMFRLDTSTGSRPARSGGCFFVG